MAVAVPWAYVHDHRCRIDRQDSIPGCLAILAIRGILDSLPTLVGAPPQRRNRWPELTESTARESG